MAIVGWLADDGDAGDFLRELISPAVDGERRALPQPGVRRALRRGRPAHRDAPAARLRRPRWKRLGADDAPWVAYGNNVSRDFFSTRIGCVTYQPVYGIDLGALCIRKGPRPWPGPMA